ncbi:uncharacterized protein [Marmota flaviventris]|uniref:uncharacterized protein n=1 Tax=Marmota flaviventris TaxID=93162 RepID=UPI003A85D8E0
MAAAVSGLELCPSEAPRPRRRAWSPFFLGKSLRGQRGALPAALPHSPPELTPRGGDAYRKTTRLPATEGASHPVLPGPYLQRVFLEGHLGARPLASQTGHVVGRERTWSSGSGPSRSKLTAQGPASPCPTCPWAGTPGRDGEELGGGSCRVAPGGGLGTQRPGAISFTKARAGCSGQVEYRGPGQEQCGKLEGHTGGPRTEL